jgi:MFS transporter, FHS family, L-fucose permease
MKTQTNYGALSVLITVFFFWGFIAAGNSIFIPFCKNYFNLDQFQSQLIDFAFYFAYYIGALVLFIKGSVGEIDPVGGWGYKKSIVYGLLFSALGAIAMIISVQMNVFTGMLFGLFIVALGFSLQQTAANPFIIALGDESTGSNRVSLGGGINSLGTTIGPLVVALALFGTASVDDDLIQSLSLDKVILLYSCVGILFLLTAALFGFSKKVPTGKYEEKTEKANKSLGLLLVITGLLIGCFAPVFNSYRSTEAKQILVLEQEIKQTTINSNTTIEMEKLNTELLNLKYPLEKKRMVWLSLSLLVIVGGLGVAFMKSKKDKKGWGAMQYPQLILGMLAIFFYVGVEVAIGSNLGEFLNQPQFGGYTSSEIAPFIAMYWGSLMIGRWAGAVHAFELSQKIKLVLTTIVPLVAYFIILGLTYLAGHEIKELYAHLLFVMIQIVGFYIGKNKPARTLFVFSLLAVISTSIGVFAEGKMAVFALLSTGLFCSIMWPCIFSLSISGLGKYKSQGSAFLIMMILGGAIIPPIQGKLSDIIGIQNSFFIGVICFIYLLIFAIFVRKILKNQGVSFE